MKINITQQNYYSLINNTILNIDNEEKTVIVFFDFLRAIGFVNKEDLGATVPGVSWIYEEDLAKLTYENLHEVLRNFIKSLSYFDLDNPEYDAMNILNYLYVLYYRAFISEKNKGKYNDIFSYGMSCDQAHQYFYGKKLSENLDSLGDDKSVLRDYYDFCIRQKILNYYVQTFEENNSFSYIFEKAQYEDFDESMFSDMNDSSFKKLHISMQNLNGLMDYRLYCHLLILTLKELEKDEKNFTDDEMLSLLIELPALEKARDSKEHMNFYDFLNLNLPFECRFIREKILNVNSEIFFNSEYVRSLLTDLLDYESPDLVCAILNSNESRKLQSEFNQDRSEFLEQFGLKAEPYIVKDLAYFRSIFEKEEERRANIEIEKIRKEASLIKDKKPYILNFLKNSLNANYPLFEEYKINEERFEELYNKIILNQEAENVIAGFESRFESMNNNGLSIDDYTFAICGPIKLIEKMLKLEIAKNYSTNAYLCKKEKSPISGLYFWTVTNEKLVKDTKSVYRDLTLGPATVALQNCILNANKEKPWFFVNSLNPLDDLTTNCPFYEDFGKKVRNGYFHTDIISSMNKGKDLFYKVAFWFVQCLNDFNPY